MARPISWLPRLKDIRKTVANSVRSHYSCRDLGQIFKLQPRAMNDLMGVLPVIEIGRSRLVGRDALVSFLDRVNETEDVASLCIKQKEKVSRKLPRALVLRDYRPINPAALAPWIERGRFKGFDFEDPAEVADVLWRFACAMDGESLEEFIRLYAPAKPVSSELDLERADAQALKAEIEQMEADWVRLQAAKKIA